MSNGLYERILDYAKTVGLDPEDAENDLLDWALTAHEQVITRTRMIQSATSTLIAEHKREQGLYTGGRPPYGFTVADDETTLIEVESEQRVIAKARELRAAGMSLRAIGLTLDEQGIRGRTGRPFAPLQISRMLEVTKGLPF